MSAARATRPHRACKERLCTQAPGTRRRALARPAGDDEAAALRFWDGTLEQYARRPRQRGDQNARTMPDFNSMLYQAFHRDYEVVSLRNVSAELRQSRRFYSSCFSSHCSALPSEMMCELLCVRYDWMRRWV